MPTYDYQCSSCEYLFEEFQSITAKPLKKCPQCGKMTLKRLLGTGAGIIFKGSGFYETDYRSDSYKKAAESEKKPAEKSEKKQPACAGSCDSCPAAKETSKPAADKKTTPKKKD